MADMEKNLEASAKALPLLKKKFDERQRSLIAIMIDCDKHIV